MPYLLNTQKHKGMKTFYTVILLTISNTFMTLAWYGHLFWKGKLGFFEKMGLFGVILLSWAIALFEYIFQVPANKIGHKENGGPFTMFELKTIQEFISISVFMFFLLFVFKEEKPSWNHYLGILLMIAGVFFVFKKF